MLHGVRAEPGPLETGVGRPQHAAVGPGRVQPSQELSTHWAAAVLLSCKTFLSGSALSPLGTSVWGEGG